MSPTLESVANEQSNLLAALFKRSANSNAPDEAPTASPSPAASRLAQRGMDVYRANAAVLAEKTLSSTFPVLAQLIGMDSFEPLARHFWQQHPPQRGDLAQWGAELPAYLAAAPQLAAEPYLADVARVEWALHSASAAADAVLDAASFTLLTHAEINVTLTLSEGCMLIASGWPVATLVNAHLTNEPTLEVAALMLASGTSEVALVWRQGFKPRVRAVGAAEAALIAALLEQRPLDAALQSALDKDAAFDFNDWLGQCVQSGLVTGAARCAPVDAHRNTNN